ncbi:MAG: hypothetical protein ABW171_13795 [Steroidobacter sp.]
MSQENDSVGIHFRGARIPTREQFLGETRRTGLMLFFIRREPDLARAEIACLIGALRMNVVGLQRAEANNDVYKWQRCAATSPDP